jgi:predicted PurR-regulated permease PerM
MAAANDSFVRRTIIVVGIAAAAVLLVLAVWVASSMLLLIFGGILLAVLLRGLADQLSALLRIRERWSVWIVISAFAGLLVVGAWQLSAEIAGQFDELGKSLTAIWEQVRSQLEKYAWGREALSVFGSQETTDERASAIGSIVAAVLGGISGLLLSLMLGIYIAADPTLYRSGFLRLVPMRFRNHTAAILDELHDTLRSWLMGTALIMVIVGTMTALGLWLLGIPNALALGLLAFALEFIPYIGPILSAIPAVLVAATIGSQEVLFVLLLYWAIQSLEGYVVSPLVHQKSEHIPPMLTISAQVVLGTVLGVLGIIFATPLMACALVLTQRLYVEDTLGDELERPLKRKLAVGK